MSNNDEDFPLEACKRFLERQFGQDLVLPIYKWIVPYPKNRAQLVEWVDRWVDDPSSMEDPIGCWDTSQVTDFSFVCSGSRNQKLKDHHFDEELKWDFSNAINMERTFERCRKFKGLGADQWNVSKVTNMDRTFFWCSKFNGDVSGWNISSVTNMEYMFFRCSSFNRDLSTWDVSNVTAMGGMLVQCTAMENLPIWYEERRPAQRRERPFSRCNCIM